VESGATRYDPAIIEQAVLAILFEMRALITLFERKGFLRPGEVSDEIRGMKRIAAGADRPQATSSGKRNGADRAPHLA
jgi:hypothetical protein